MGTVAPKKKMKPSRHWRVKNYQFIV